MSLKNRTGRTNSKKAARKSRAAEIANTLEWLITTLIWVILGITFLIRSFIIPTGSMANTLKGAHFCLRCRQCGYKYDYGFVPEKYGLPQNTIPRAYLKPTASRCPNCGYYQPTGGKTPISKGDKILVLKCIYQFFEPKRWDVIVFKNPLEPQINYIKRLIALPGETVEIIDGDIYINGHISRKPAKVQNELWMPVYDNDYQPARPTEPFFNNHKWQQPFDITDSKWTLDKANPTIFHLDSPVDESNSLIYETTVGNDFRATYAYNDVRQYNRRPYCSDLMVRFYVRSANPYGRIGIEMSKYNDRYKAWVDFTGELVIGKVSKGEESILDRKLIELPVTNEPTLVKFANVDHQLIFQFGTEELTHDFGRDPEAAGRRTTAIQPQVKIFGSGKLTLSHIAIFRDIHYTTADGLRPARAEEGNPFTLGKDEFFVLGDNSPGSMDGRWWSQPGKGNNDRLYRQGIVPREYLIGKALFVVWPSGFKPFAKFPFSIIPDVSRMRLIYGGSSKKP